MPNTAPRGNPNRSKRLWVRLRIGRSFSNDVLEFIEGLFAIGLQGLHLDLIKAARVKLGLLS